MSKARWKPFPHPEHAYGHAGADLAAHWARLHQGDREVFPDAAALGRLVKAHPRLTPKVPLEAAATTLQDAWRAYHRGDFAAAVELGLKLGPIGTNVANKATNIYATYLETADKAKLDLFQQSAKRAEDLMAAAETLPNAWYFHAQALGRYGQGISVATALAEGLGGKIRHSLERALKLEPRHADAHIALGAYHAEVIAKMGAMIGALTYGVSRDVALEHFARARKLNPQSAIARIEEANALVKMFGRDRLEAATRLYADAAKITPMDAMERLDQELARAELVD